ncbi:MAG: DPP IV N-terminal domain-containing protein [Acidobacteria bacterium]|nr:DPP IV N-terminal domain-containing protein [Acidobacteriota bacterium]MCI0718178.1 DPP IV N-terminal domain-containing protein [Acidobacteriota bacterium]
MISAQILFLRLKICLTLRSLSLPVRLAAILLGIDLVFLPIISHAQTANTRVLPGLANVSGANGTKFESTVWITNLGSAASSVELGLVPFGGVTAPSVQVRPISRGETLRFNNVLRDLFGLEETAGALTAGSSQPFDLRGVTANVSDPTGTFGLSVQSVAASALLRAGQAGHSIWLSHGTDLSRGFRTNVTVVLTEPNSSVEVSLYDEGNTLRGVKIVSSPAPVTWQASSSQLLSNPELPVGRVKFAVTAGAATAYTSVVDNITGDGIVVQPERSGSGTTDLLLNGVVRTPGANNTFFATDVRLFNPNESPLTVTIDALGFAGGTRTISRALAAGGLVEILDVLGPNGFNFPEGSAGALRFRAASAFLVAGRTNNLNGKPGSFGTFQRAVPFGSGFITSAKRGTLIGLNQNASVPGFRSNIAFFGGPGGSAGTLRLCDQLGLELASVPLTLAPQQWFQQRITGWFEGVEIPRDARVDVQLGSGSLDGYAAIVDNKTGDGVVVPLIVATAELIALADMDGSQDLPNRLFREQIFTMRPDGTNRVKLTNDSGSEFSRNGMPAWSPDGKKIAYAHFRTDGVVRIKVMDADGSNTVTLTTTGVSMSPSWSPDGKTIAYSHTSTQNTGQKLWLMNADGTNPRALTTGPGHTDEAVPVWSPDGKKISFTSSRDGGKYRIWVMNADGSNPVPLTTTYYDTTLDAQIEQKVSAWSPDGQYIAYWAGVEVNIQRPGLPRDVWVMRADGSDQRKLVHGDAPFWSPDSQTIGFPDDTTPGQIKVGGISPDGTNKRTLFVTNGGFFRASWQLRASE